MENKSKIKWHQAYGFLASLLFQIYKKYGEQCGPVLYDLLNKKKVFTDEDKWFITITVDKMRDSHGEVAKRISKTMDIIESDDIGIRPEITPLQIFASFNDINTTEEFRTKRYKILYDFFSSVIIAPDNPNPNNGEFEFYLNQEIQSDDFQLDYEGWVGGNVDSLLFFQREINQNEIWESLRHVFEGTNTDLTKFYKKHVLSWHKIDLSSFTLFLYWINAYRYFPLSKDVVRVLTQIDGDTEIYNSFSEYIKLCNSYKTITDKFINLVLFSQGKIEEDKVDFFDKIKKKQSFVSKRKDLNIDIVRDFKVLGLKINEGKKDVVGKGKYYKSLKPNFLYKFYDCYEFSKKEKTIKYKKEKDFDFYTGDSTTKISVSAVVGKNGSGKSSLFDIMMMIIYKLSVQTGVLKETEEEIVTGDTIPNGIIKRIEKIRKNLKKNNYDEELDLMLKSLERFNIETSKVESFEFLNAELFIRAGGIFKIEVKTGFVKIFKYRKDKSNKYTFEDVEHPCVKDILSRLFYSIAINYSIYSLNRKDAGDWIYPLFHKNDSYQTPIVIEPYRRDGNIDINRQSYLVKTRMLANILEPEIIDSSDRRFNNSFRRVAEERGGKEFKDVEEICLVKNRNKLSRSIQMNNKDVPSEYLDNYYDALSEEFGFKGIFVEEEVKTYLLHKFVTIASRYTKYRDYVRVDATGIRDPKGYSKELFKDNSHVTNKLRQAINYCKYGKEELYSEGKFFVGDIVKKIENIKLKDSSLSTIDLIPPSFFDIEIILRNEEYKDEKDDIPFNTLSSGEKQLNYAINSILYHLKNIDSVSDELTKYRYVNVMLDEVELYFHPEMQRRYIYYLLEGIKRTKFNYIDGINICIITHSPYMLSDIPETNILFIGNKGEVETKKPKTFGANIHDLLIEGFFMDNSMGDFVLTKVKEIIEFYSEVKEKSFDIIELDIESRKSKIEGFRLVVDNIGEDYLRGVLNEHLLFIENELLGNDYKISKLKEEIKK